MSLKQFVQRHRFVRKVLLYLFHKYKNKNKVTFYWSSDFSYRCNFEGKNYIGPHTSFFGSVGYGTYIDGGCFISANVGRFCSIGARCKYINTTHPYKTPFATTSPYFTSNASTTFFGRNGYADRLMFEEFKFYDKEKELVNKIGNDCWFGTDVTLLGGIEIGNGAVVLAKAFVTKDVPPYAIVGGIPAKIIGYRYDEETIEFLQKIQWWNNDEQWFKENWELLCDIEKLKEFYKS